MTTLKAFPSPTADVQDLSRVQSRALAGLGTAVVTLVRGGQTSIGGSRELLAALPVAIYTTDADGRITFFNEAAATLWGQRPVLGSDRYCGSWRIQAEDGTPVPHDELGLATPCGPARTSPPARNGLPSVRTARG